MEDDDFITLYDDLKVVRIEEGKFEEEKAKSDEMQEKLGIPEAKRLVKESLVEKGLPADEAERVSEGEGVHIALMNSGLDENHPDIKDALAEEKGKNCIRWLCRGTKEDYVHTPNPHYDTNDISCSKPHCLSVSGIIASKKFGILKRAKLHVVKVCDENHHGKHITLLSGLHYVHTHRRLLDLVNMSIGLKYDHDFTGRLFEACEDLSKDVILVASAGNEGCGPSIPSTSEHVLSVGATRRTETDPDYHTVCDFSNKWVTVDIAAPGEKIPSLDVKRHGEKNYCRAYSLITGSSAATPIIASVLGMAVAYIKRKNALAKVTGSIDITGLERILKETACSDEIRPCDFDASDSEIEEIFGAMYGFHLMNPDLSADDFRRFAAGAGRVDATGFMKCVIREYG